MSKTTQDMPVRTVGVDLGDETATYVILDADGATHSEGSFAMTADGVDGLFGQLPASRVVVEASTQSNWVARRVQALGHEVIVANPRRVHLISKSSRKTDRNDAHTLARLGRVDPQLLHPVWLRSDECLAARAALKARTQLVRTRTRLITLVRSECKVHGVRLPICASSSFVKVAPLRIPEILRGFLQPIFDVLRSLTEQIDRYDKLVQRLCEHEFPQTGALQQVSGVGPLVSLAFVLAIGDPKRFPDSRQVGAYVGLVPRLHQSGQSDPHLQITKEGDRDLRALLVNSATYILRRSSPDCALKRCGRKIAKRGNPRDKSRARIAVARRLAVLLHRLWLTGEQYEPLRAAPIKA
jgi:transposase